MRCLDSKERSGDQLSLERSHENVIEFLDDETEAMLTLSKGRYISRVKKLAETHPGEVYIKETVDGTIFAKVPVKWVKISPPKTISEEQKKRSRENIMKMWENKRTECDKS